MLRPTKHSHPDRTVINVSLLLLSRLKDRRVDEYDVLRKLRRSTSWVAMYFSCPRSTFSI